MVICLQMFKSFLLLSDFWSLIQIFRPFFKYVTDRSRKQRKRKKGLIVKNYLLFLPKKGDYLMSSNL